MAGKRPYSHFDSGQSSESNGKLHNNKRHQSSFRRSNSGNGGGGGGSRVDEAGVFRILCLASKIGGVIGKGGSIIKALRHETGAKIKIEDAVQGSDERVIVISAFDRDPDGLDDDSAAAVGAMDSDDRGIDDYTQGKDVSSPTQLALFKVHTRILDADKYDDELDELDELLEDDSTQKVITRLLVPENQVGCLLGKRGRIIEQMREETGSQIRILPREQLPACALPTDEVVQVAGDRASVKKALYAISTRLLDNPPKERPPIASFQSSPYPPRNSFLSHGDSFLQHGALVPQARLGHSSSRNEAAEVGMYQLLRPTAPGLSEYGGGRHLVPIDEELIFRVLCPLEKIGSIIGKGGSIIQTLRDETGAKIKVADPVPGSEERVIIVSAVECPDDDLSPAQEAVFHIQDRMRDAVVDPDNVVTRLLVPSNQVGCLLGKGGNIITEMRKLTRANIRILSKEQLPMCALENDEVVQIIGEIRVARDALVRITSRLRANLYREKSDTGRSDADFGGYQRSSSPIGYSSSMPSFGLQGSQTSSIQTPRSPRSWVLQNDRGLASLGGIDRSFGGIERGFGLGGGSTHPSSLSGALANLSTGVVTSTRIEVFIPEVAVPAVLGQNGSNIAQICKISGAKINLVDGYSGATADRVIEISGTPEQTNAAKSLVEAFVVSGQF